MKKAWWILAVGLIALATMGCNPTGPSDAECLTQRPLHGSEDPNAVTVGKNWGSSVEWLGVDAECVGAWDRAGYTLRLGGK